MKSMKKKFVSIGLCAVVFLAVSMMTGCSLDRKAKDTSAQVESFQTKKEITPTSQPAPTQQVEQKTNEANQSNNTQSTDSDVQTGGQDSAGAAEGDGSDGDETPSQGFFSVRLYSPYGGFVDLERAEDGEFYDTSGTLYPGVDDASVNLDPVTNEEGSTFYWRESDVEELEELPFQGESQAMVYDIDTRDGFVIKRGEDGIWRDADGVSFGDAEDALLAGEPVTNENGETYYWTLPEE